MIHKYLTELSFLIEGNLLNTTEETTTSSITTGITTGLVTTGRSTPVVTTAVVLNVKSSEREEK